MKAEEVHVKHKPVVIYTMCWAVPREAAAHIGHVGVKTLHGLIQAVLGAAADHDIGMPQLLMITFQILTNNYHSRRLNTHPPGGKGLKELGRRESVPTSDNVQDGGCCLIGDSHGVVCGRAHPHLPALLPTGHGTVHLIRVIGGKADHGQRPRSSPASTKQFHFVYLVVDLREQMSTYHTHVARPLVHGHA